MNCNFNLNDFLCGYQVEFTSAYTISRHQVDRDNEKREPTVDGARSEIGYCMYADPKSGEPGSKAFLISPPFEVFSSTLVSLRLYFNTHSTDTDSEIQVFLVTAQRQQYVSVKNVLSNISIYIYIYVMKIILGTWHTMIYVSGNIIENVEPSILQCHVSLIRLLV